MIKIRRESEWEIELERGWESNVKEHENVHDNIHKNVHENMHGIVNKTKMRKWLGNWMWK